MVEGRVEGRECHLTVDTGSEISIVRYDLVQSMSRVHLRPQVGWLRTATGERTPIRGWSKMELVLGRLKTTHNMVVADIKDECILGTDFLTPHQCVVDLKNNTLTVGREQVPLRMPRQVTILTCCKVTLEDCVDLPPFSETVTYASIQHRPSSMVWGILEPSEDVRSKPLDGLLVGRALVDTGAESVPVRLLNLTRLPKRIKRGTQVATCSAVESVLVESNMEDVCERFCKKCCFTDLVVQNVDHKCVEPEHLASCVTLGSDLSEASCICTSEMAGSEVEIGRGAFSDMTCSKEPDDSGVGYCCDGSCGKCYSCKAKCCSGKTKCCSGKAKCCSGKAKCCSDKVKCKVKCGDSCQFIPTGTKGPAQPVVHNLTQYLRGLYARSTIHVNTQEAQEVYELLCEFADTFSEGAHDLGRTDLVKHQINTRDAVPIRQPPR